MPYKAGQTATNSQTGEKVVFDGNTWVPAQGATAPEQPGEFSATEGMSPLEAGLVGAGRTMLQIGETLGIRPTDPAKRFDREDDRSRYSEVAEEFPIASAVGEAAPTLALPGGIAAQVGYSAALPYLQNPDQNPWMQSAAGAGITAGLGAGGRIFSRLNAARAGKFGRTTDSGVTATDFGEGVGGRMAQQMEQQASSRITGRGPRAAINAKNDELLQQRVASWLGQDGTPSLSRAYDDVEGLYARAATSGKSVALDEPLKAELESLGINRVTRMVADELDPVALTDVRNTLSRVRAGERGKIAENIDDALTQVDDLMVEAGFDPDTLKQARTLYGRWKTLAERNVIEEAGEAAGSVNAGALRSALRKGKATKGKSQKGRLDPETQQLADTASDVLDTRRAQRTSMTPERLPVEAALGAGAYAVGGLPAAAASFLAPGVISRGLLGQASEGLLTPYVAGAAGRVIPQQVE